MRYIDRAHRNDEPGDISILELSLDIGNTSDQDNFVDNSSYNIRAYWDVIAYYQNVEKNYMRKIRHSDVTRKYINRRNHQINYQS